MKQSAQLQGCAARWVFDQRFTYVSLLENSAPRSASRAIGPRLQWLRSLSSYPHGWRKSTQ
ncbi:MAG: hypothetical protein EAZ24_15455 [Burkholderiales bacterium]|nr:MAG: hypothetical protein EAZ24_15455 [Burkholderiales bacterium]TAG78244.1 MAG: hypothetical protein EAZ21_13150 [Betaproteobacteria bacterium]